MPHWLSYVVFVMIIPGLFYGVLASIGSYTGWWFWARKSARTQRQFTNHVDKTIRNWLAAE